MQRGAIMQLSESEALAELVDAEFSDSCIIAPVATVTLKRPWPYAIIHLGKDVENRTWPLLREAGSTIAIHAGKGWDQDGADWIESAGLGTVPPESKHPAGAIVALATFRGNSSVHNSPWFFGPWGWNLSDIQPIKPIPWRGQQGIWTWPGGEVEFLGNCHNPTTEDTNQCAAQKNLDLPGVSENSGQELDQASPAATRSEILGQLSHSDFEPGSRVWLPMVYYGESIWAEFEIISDTGSLGEYIAIGRNEVRGTLVCDSLVVNEWFKSRARKNPPEIVSDSAKNQGFQPFELSEMPDFSDSRSDSASPRRSSDFWQEAGPYRSKGRVYYRYRWGKGSKIEGTKHIPGGCMLSDLVRNRAFAVYRAVYWDKKPHAEVLELVKGWGRNRR